MSNWLTRLDNALVTIQELERLPHRLRVAWAYYGVTAVLKKVSRYFVETSGIGIGLRAVEEFILNDTIDYPLIREAHALLDARRSQLQSEGYDIQEFVMGSRLFASIRTERVLESSPEGRELHSTCDADCCYALQSCEAIQSSTGVFYVRVAQWIYGIGACKIDNEALDDLQDCFFRFSRKVYDYLATGPACPLTLDGNPGLELSWDIPEPVKAEMMRTRWLLPPEHERSR